MIPLSKPFLSGEELQWMEKVIREGKFSGDGKYTHYGEEQLETLTGASRVLLTSSCTHALEMAALISGIQAGEEVIMPSFNFVSAANAFALRGARLCFVDTNPTDLNLNAEAVARAVNAKTKAILVLHYGGVSCQMEAIMKIAEQYQLIVIEDAAHCAGAYRGKQHLGTIGHLGTLSFHDTKNIHCGEGGALLINKEEFISTAEIVREKGTDKKQFLRDQSSSYSWRELGSSYLMNELSAAFLIPQLKYLAKINEERRNIWIRYHKQLSPLAASGHIRLPLLPTIQQSNGHIFYLTCRNQEERDTFIQYSAKNGIQTAFHYLPLHLSTAGRKWGYFSGIDRHTTLTSNCLVRLPLFNGLKQTSFDHIIDVCYAFFNR